ncbi:GNAT family N-acetyltransferase [Cellulomonas cellasea]|uniref:GNAT family N-acetyltransferase n=1 Tax=Cellulomonas cellasea TaxID=43670 RepID=UPI0025A31314|nr:GNAT family N-acetyltransferase [Cellulomonas cellasea]MDM8084970.1 GNAT family N-acetyltransferase [Cellulomonas cellasea]
MAGPLGAGGTRRAQVRPARVDDTADLARVHVAAWLGAYRGLLPDAFLDALDVADSQRRWDSLLADGLRPHLLVGVLDGRVVGFVNSGPAFESVPDGEVYALYVDPDAWGTGVGPTLLAAAEDELRGLGHREAVLWVMPGNTRARRFYERSGWAPTGLEAVHEAMGLPVDVVQHAKTLDP